MSSHTLTFSGVTVKVDGTSVASPYTLTKSCTIEVTTTDIMLGVVVNGQSSFDSNTIALSDTDIDVSTARGAQLSQITINYTA